MIKLAIVGYRDFEDYEKFTKIVNNEVNIKNIECIISGGCSGVDKMAEKYASDNKIKCIIFKADWKKYGKSAGPRRNNEIVKEATMVIALPSHNSKGTLNTIETAKKKFGKDADKFLKVIWID